MHLCPVDLSQAHPDVHTFLWSILYTARKPAYETTFVVRLQEENKKNSIISR